MIMKNSLSKKFIGDKAFYRRVLAVAVPIMVQSGITNFVSLLDNIMVGRTGTEQMSGVAIVNQLIFVFYLCCFGGFSGAGMGPESSSPAGVRPVFRSRITSRLCHPLAPTARAAPTNRTAGERETAEDSERKQGIPWARRTASVNPSRPAKDRAVTAISRQE